MSLDSRFVSKAYYIVHFTQKLRNWRLMCDVNVFVFYTSAFSAYY
jgi:hypothetical protein